MNEQLIKTINTLKAEIDALRPLDKDTEGRIQQKFRLDWNYHSNNIEGNSLTFGETKTFLLHGITADGKPLKDHLDIKGHNTALEMLEDVVHDGRDLNETFIRELHQIILHEPYDKPAVTPDGKKTNRRIQIGKYKTQPNHVVTKTGETFYFATPEETPALMNDLMNWFNQSIKERKLHPVELAALLHYKFIRIHPFDDGNGRLSRILMNLTLMKFGLPPVIIKTQKKEEYYRALQQADGGDNNFFVEYIAKLQIDSLELYLRGAKGEHIEEEDDLDKEIALFKAKINHNTLTNKHRSSQNQILFFKNVLIPLLQKVLNTLTKFNPLFESFYFEYQLTNDIFYTNTPVMHPIGQIILINEFIDELEIRSKLDTNFLSLHITAAWYNLKASNLDENRLNYKLYVKFNKANVTIKYDGSPGEKIFLYTEKLSQEQINQITRDSAENLMKQIEHL